MNKKKHISSWHTFSKRKSCLTSLTTFYNEICVLANERKAVDIVYLDFSKAFDTIPRKVLIEKLLKCELHEPTVKWIENLLNSERKRC